MLYSKSVHFKLGIISWIMLFESFLIAVEWQKIEQATQNTVLQVWSQGSKKSWLEPYKAPVQHQGVGTAFFINSDGDMLTNFHVVDGANFVYVLVPSGGRKPFEARIKGVCPEQDIAVLELTEASRTELVTLLGSISYLTLGNSDMLAKTEPIMALGYPLGSRYSKSTIGEIAGYEYIGGSSFIHMTAPINPGNSGGPLMDKYGEVVGVNSAIMPGSQNICFIIPSADVSSILPQLYDNPLYRKPRLDFRLNPATKEHAEFLKCPIPGGSFINKVLRGSSADRMGVKQGDMLYQVIWNGVAYDIDEYGDVKVDWRISDKISLRELMLRFKLNDSIDLVVYRNGERLKLSTILTEPPKYPGRYICVGFEPDEMDFVVLFGTVFMQLRQNHIEEFATATKKKNNNIPPKFEKYLQDPSKEAVIITYIHNGSQLQKVQCFSAGDVIEEVNGKKVTTLAELRSAFLESVKSGYISLSTKEGYSTVLSLDKVLNEEPKLASEFGYPLTDHYKHLRLLRPSAR